MEWAMSCFRWITYSLIYTFYLAIPAKADILLQPDHEMMVLRSEGVPIRGMTQSQVEKKFGEPRAIQAAVGDPPISSWDYDNYRVYFEHQLVLHVVVHQ
jgi:hypothetical protein